MPDFNPGPTEILFLEALALIVAACIFAPLFRKLGLGTILGFLAAGVAVKVTLSLSFSDHPEELLHFAEFGVVLFLFVIGLELKPSRLWAMRGDIFGLGLAQMLACGVILGAVALLFDFPWMTALVIGFGLALSSTALVMQTLEERHERATPHGRKAFAILLFQDIAIVPLLILVALLAPVGDDVSFETSLIRLGLAVGAIVGLVLIGRYLLDPIFRLLAQTRMQEITTAGALGVVIASGFLMNYVGMSYAMGAFIAGVMLAESSYRHEIEADIEPFRGLFLGLFFMAVGVSLDLNAVVANWAWIITLAPAAMLLKGVTIYAVARLFKNDHPTSIRTAFALPQHGEFGFVLFAAAASSQLIGASQSAILVAIVTVSMAISPLISFLEPLFLRKAKAADIEEDYSDAKGRVMLIGFGRFGQIVSQPLFAKGIDVTILDNDPDRIREAERFGFRVYFGDGQRRDVLRAAGADEVELIVVCTDAPATTSRIVDLVQSDFAHARLHARSYDRRHSIELMNRDIDFAVRETFESALRIAGASLQALGLGKDAVTETLEEIRRLDRDRLRAQIEGDLKSGLNRLHVQAVKPEPLVEREGD